MSVEDRSLSFASSSTLTLVHPPTAFPTKRPQPLGRRLVEAGLLHADQLEAALKRQSRTGERGVGKRLGEVIVEMGLVDEADLLPLLGEQLGVAGIKLRESLVDPAVIPLVPRNVATRLAVLPLAIVDDELTVAMTDPKDTATLMTLSRIVDASIQRLRQSGDTRFADIRSIRLRPVLTLHHSIERLIPRCYEADFSTDAVTADHDDDDLQMQPDAVDLDAAGGLGDIEGSPVINLVNYTIVQAVRQGASDIHIEPGMRHTSIRFRVDGVLREVMKPRRDLHAAVVSRIKVISKLDIAEHRRPQDGRLHIRVQRRDIDLRISTLPTVTGEKVVMRVLDRKNVTFDLASLGLPDDSLTSVRGMLKRPHGLVLVTGPTGSGKTTTLYSAIELIKGVGTNIVTVEDPVEYQLDLINQVQIRRDDTMTFASALRSILRQDPDVIMVGEIRDRETAETAIGAALTGHLVLSTLHTNDSASAITRLVDMGVDRFKIAASLVGVIAQRLVRNLCPQCREVYYPTSNELASLRSHGSSHGSASGDAGTMDDFGPTFARPRGCSECFDSGYKGRTGLYELLALTPEIRTMVNEHATAAQIAAANPRRLLFDEGMALIRDQVSSVEEVLRVAAGDNG